MKSPCRLARAIEFASMTLEGMDKSGLPLIWHSIRIMMKGDVSNEEDLILRVIHDVPEEVCVPENTLRFIRNIQEEFKLSNDATEVLDLLTHMPKQSYIEYITLISKNKWATKIKLDDINDNLTRDHSGISENDLIRMTEKYGKAIAILKGVL